MPTRASAALLALATSLACVSCTSLQSITGLAWSAMIGPDPRSPADEVENERMLREKTRMADDTDLHSSTCFAGIVSSRGALGEPLEGVDVDVAFAGGTLGHYARTDAHGQFHVCLARQSRGTFVELVTGEARFIDHSENVRMVFTRLGWATEERDVFLDTGDGDRSLDVTLDRDELGRFSGGARLDGPRLAW